MWGLVRRGIGQLPIMWGVGGVGTCTERDRAVTYNVGSRGCVVLYGEG